MISSLKRFICWSVLLFCVACADAQSPTVDALATVELPATVEPAIAAGGGALLDDSALLTDEELALTTAEEEAVEDAAADFPTSTIALPMVDPLTVEGDITVGGSITVYPITRRLYRRFVREGYAGIMKIERVGTGEGFRLLCSVGTADIVNAGRDVRESELTLCDSIGREPLPFAIGQGAVSLLIHPENDFLESVTLPQLRTIFTATHWSEVDPTWPTEPIDHLLPRVTSDEVAAFTRLVMDGDSTALLTAPNTTTFATESELLQALTDNPYAIGFASHILLLREGNEFAQSLPIEGQLPNEESVYSGSYPLVYPLYLYTDPGILRDKPQVAAFLNFTLSHINEEIRQVGYFPADVVAMDAARTQLLRIVGGILAEE